MSYFVRKVSINKWKIDGGIEDLDYIKYPSASITNDIKINNNKLSVWEIDSIPKIDEIALALACTLQKPDRMQVFYVEHDQLTSAGFEFDDQSGETPIDDLNHLHHNIINLKTVEDACRLAKHFYLANITRNYKVYTENEIKGFINEAIRKKRLDPNQLNNDLKKHFLPAV